MTRKNLIIVRGGDESLHPTWLAQKEIPRSWDLHISYFGSKDAPAHAGEDGVTFTKDDARYKWGGMHVCLGKNPVDLDAYEYIAFPDDDLVVTTEGWNKAFELMKRFDLRAAQLSLHHNSFYTINLTLRRPWLLLRYVNVIECMAPIARTEVFKHAAQYFPDQQSAWGIDTVIADCCKDDPKSQAVLDAVPALHTRAHGVSPMYKDMTKDGMSYYEQEAAFLARHGLKRLEREVLGGVDLGGREVRDLAPIRRKLVRSYLLRALRNARGQTRVVTLGDGEAALARAMRMVTPRAV